MQNVTDSKDMMNYFVFAFVHWKKKKYPDSKIYPRFRCNVNIRNNVKLKIHIFN